MRSPSCGERLFGAVELYTTTSSINTYPDAEPSPPKPADFPVVTTGQEDPTPSSWPQLSDYPHYSDFKKAFEEYAENFKTN